MKKLLPILTLFVFYLIGGINVFAEDFTFNATDIQNVGNKDAGNTATNGSFTFTAVKNYGTVNPTFNANGGDVRLYAKNTLTITNSAGNMTKIVFTISTQGKKRLTEVAASTGTIAMQAVGDETVTWTGNATEVTFTVGDEAIYGSDGGEKAGQLDFSSLVITADVGSSGETPITDPDSIEQTNEEKTIAEINELTEDVKNVKIVLNNAVVTYVEGTTHYLRENGKCVMLYNTTLSYTVGDVLKGSVIMDYDNFYGIHQMRDNDATSMHGITVIGKETPIPTEVSISDIIAFNNICDYIVLKNVKVVKDGNNYFALDNAGNNVQLYKGLNVSSLADDGFFYDIEGIFNKIYKARPQIQPVAITQIANLIEFSDDFVKALCLAFWDNNNDKELDMDEAAVVTDLSSVFTNNTDITSFDELQYFTGLTSIGEQAFYNCSNLKSIIIPENVTTIGNRAFYNCSGLETIEVDENNQYYDSRNNCNALIQTSSNTLLVGCKNSVIPDGVTSIAEGAFRGCTELTNIVIPEGVKTIGASAFRGCTGLTSVSLPSTITSIGNYAFSAFDEVYNLTTVSVGMTSPVAIASEVFPNRANSILYVPKGSRPAYKAANYWKEFKQIIEFEDGVPVKCEKPTITFFASGKIKVESATEGATCITTIIASNAEPLTDGEISLKTPLTVYTVKAYATAEGYADSDEATATFRWEKAEGDMNGDGTVNIADVVQLVNMILGN